MGKRFKPQGKAIKMSSDPSLARGHAAGAPVTAVQPALDPVWGLYLFKMHRRCPAFFRAAKRNFSRTERLIDKCRQLKPIKDQNTRFLTDGLTLALEEASSQYLLSTKLCLQYLGVEIISYINNALALFGQVSLCPFDAGDTTDQQLSKAIKLLDLSIKIPAEVHEILNRRDNLEHPTPKMLSNTEKGQWEMVQLAWVLSGKVLDTWKPIENFITVIEDAFQEWIKANSRPGTLHVTRALKSTHPLKKHPLHRR